MYVAEVIRARVREEGFDYALIDSRTGWSEAAGFCVLGLAGALAVVSGLNEENLLGTKDFLEFVAGREGEAPKPILRVLSPVPTAEEELKEKRFRRAQKLLGGEAAVQIPCHPRIALIEEPFVVTQPDHYVTEQYRKAARAVLGLVGDDPETHLREAARLISEDKVEESLSRLRRACSFAKDQVIQILRLVTTQVLTARGDVPPWSNDAYLLLTRLDPEDEIAFNNWGYHLGSLARLTAQEDPKAAQDLFNQAFQKYQKAIGIKPDKHEAFNNWGSDLARLAEMVWKDKRKTAEKHFQDAEKRLREAVRLAPEKEAYRENLVTTLKRWAAKLEESGDTRAAEKKREEAEGVSSTPAPDRKKKKPKKRPAKPRTAKK